MLKFDSQKNFSLNLILEFTVVVIFHCILYFAGVSDNYFLLIVDALAFFKLYIGTIIHSTAMPHGAKVTRVSRRNFQHNRKF